MSHIYKDDDLVALLNKGIGRFAADGPSPLSAAEEKRLGRAMELVMQDPATIKKNAPRKRAQALLIDLWKYYPHAFLLCSIGTTLDGMGKLQSTTYMSAVSNWWRAAPRDTGLTQVMCSYAGLLQLEPQPARQHTGRMCMRTLLQLLLDTCPDQQIDVVCPFNEMKAETLFECAAGTIKIEFSEEYSHQIARHLRFIEGIPLPATQGSEGPAGSPDDMMMYLGLHMTDSTAGE